MREKLRSITQTCALPSICTLCNQFHRGSLALCSECIAFIPILGIACRKCAYPLPDTHPALCGACIKNPLVLDNTYVNYVFEEPLRRLLHQFKYHNGLYLTTLLGHLMHEAIKPHIQTLSSVPCLIPVPMHPQRLRQRGFNQAAVLTKFLARALKWPYNITACKKIINTPPQASLNSQGRKDNLRRAFYAKPVPFEHVILIDDLLTTGSTANELAKAIKKTGVKQVDLWCCARTVAK